MTNDTILKSGKRRSRTRKVVTLLVSLILLLTLATGATLAYMFLDTQAVTNTFTAVIETDPTIEENFTPNGWEKSAVKVNVGDPGYAVYVRAKVAINWTGPEPDYDVLALYTPEKGEDYVISYNTADWIEGSDGYWYYKYPISSGSTNNLIHSCEVKQAAPISGYTLQVDILTQTIQAAGTTDKGVPAVTDAWGVTVGGDGNLAVTSGSGEEQSGQ